MTDLPVFRAPMRSRDDDVPSGVAVEHALLRGVCGVGGRLASAPADLAAALAAVDARYGERMARRLERFADAPDGSSVWTRDGEGRLWLGHLTGEWCYDASPAASVVDLVHVRPCAWRSTPVPYRDAPAAVLDAFARGGRNWQRIRGAEDR